METEAVLHLYNQNTDIISKLLIADFMLVDTLGLLYFVSKWNYLNTDLYEKDMDTLLVQLLVTKQKINDNFS
jgi:hypothetical protein